MVSLSRTASLESAASSEVSQTTTADTEPQKSLTDVANEDTPSDAAKGTRPVGVKTRTPSHTLLSSSPSTSTINRKSRFADIGTTTNIGRASISMPPPATTPSFTYRPSTSRRPSATLLGNEKPITRASMESTRPVRPGNEILEPEDVEKTPSQSTHGAPLEPSTSLSLPEPSLKPPSSDTDGSSNRLSFSSLYSLGSAIYNGATGAVSAPQSTASSNAGSIKSNPLEQHGSNSAPLSPSKSSLKGETPSSATTATDPVSVTANAQLQHTGLLSE
ncbi:MAG: hypothetical protein Q9191_003527 [Dirinaria sp. TL-2023a]